MQFQVTNLRHGTRAGQGKGRIILIATVARVPFATLKYHDSIYMAMFEP